MCFNGTTLSKRAQQLKPHTKDTMQTLLKSSQLPTSRGQFIVTLYAQGETGGLIRSIVTGNRRQIGRCHRNAARTGLAR